MATIDIYKEIDKLVNDPHYRPARIEWLIEIALRNCDDDEVKAFLLLAKSRQHKLERPEE